MYIYDIYYEDEGCVDLTFHLVHEKEYSIEEFRSMCSEAKKLSNGGDSISNLFHHLINKYGFKNINDFRVASYKAVRFPWNVEAN